MLQAIRDRSQSVFAVIIIFIMIIPFALWGIQQYLGGSSVANVAEVNGEAITVQNFNNAYNRYRDQTRQRLVQIFRDNLNNPLFKQLMNEESMKKTVLDGMIESEVLNQAAQDAGFRMSSDIVDERIKAIPAFQKDGVFDAAIYKRQISYQGLSPAGFKALLLKDLITDQMLRGISLTTTVTKHDINEKLRLEDQKREMGYALIPAKRFMNTVKATDEDIQAMYDRHKEQYQTPERMTINYIEISVDDLAAKQTVTEAELRKYYQDNSLDYQVDKVAEKARELVKRLRAGESFATLAKEYSKDPGSAANGGDLGFFGRNVMDKAFEEAVYSMKVGEVRGPIRTSFGYHIIKLTGIKGEQRRASHILLTKDENDKSVAGIQPFEAVRARVEKDYRHKLAEKQFADIYDRLNNLTYENPTTLDVAADELQLKVKTSEPFGREGGPGILSNPRVIDAAFSDDVLNEGNNSELIELSDTDVVVLRKNSYSKPQPRPLEDVKDLVAAQVRNQKASEEAQRTGKEILAQIMQGESFDVLAKKYAFEWQKPGLIGRDNKDVNPALVQTLFKMPKPVGDKPVYQGMSLRSGDYAVITLFAVAEGDTSKQDETARSKAQAALLQAYRQSEQTAFKEQLKQQADIETYPANL